MMRPLQRPSSLTGVSNLILIFGFSAILSATAHAAPMAIDTTTKGSWVGTYGGDGYILSNFNDPSDAVKLPAYITGYAYDAGAARYTWNSNTTDVRAVQSPDQLTRKAATVYTGNTYTTTLDVNQAANFQLAIYNLDWDNYGAGGRVQTLDISVGGTPLSSDQVSSFQDGKWYVYNINATSAADDVSIKVTNNNSNAVLSAVAFSSVPEPSTGLLLVSASLGALTFRRRYRP